jgi:hypothetical protein
VFDEIVKVPPYCGVPRVSHQFPVLVVVTTTVVFEVVFVTADVVTDVGTVVAVVVVTTELVVVVAIFVVALLTQDAKSNDATRRKDKDTKINPLFM